MIMMLKRHSVRINISFGVFYMVRFSRAYFTFSLQLDLYIVYCQTRFFRITKQDNLANANLIYSWTHGVDGVGGIK